MRNTKNVEGLHEWAEYMVDTGLYWCGAAPWSNVAADSAAEYQLSGFAHSFLVALSGNAGAVDPYKLSPKGAPDNDLGGDHLNEFLYRDESSQSSAAQKLIKDLRALYHADSALPADRLTVMGNFLANLCQLIADSYELRHLNCDYETGTVISEGDDVAPDLRQTFIAMWADHPIVVERRGATRPNAGGVSS